MSHANAQDGASNRPRNPWWLRLTHASNALAWMLMTISGLFIYWANDVYTPFLKPSFYRALHLDHRLALGLALHFTFMWLFIGTGLFYVARLIRSGAWREIVPRRSDWRKIPLVALAELGLRPMPPSEGKLNPAQRCVYFSVLLAAGLEVFCGFAIYKPFQLKFLQTLFGGYEFARLIHFTIMVGLIAFFFMHVAQVIRAGRRDFFAIIVATLPQQSLASQFRRTLRTLTISVVCVALLGAWIATRPERDGVVWPLRTVLDFNGWLARNLFRQNSGEKLAQSLEASIGGSSPRKNGDIGLEDDSDEEDQLIEISQPNKPPRTIQIAELQAFQQTARSARFRCIEGWTIPITYKGLGFRDFMIATGYGTRSGQPLNERTPSEDLYPFVGFETANHKYYVSIDMASALHPQTVLAFEMNGKALTDANGAPVRLVIPVKYGIKNIKRIKRIVFSNERPPDYWEERGYDWFAGL